MVTAVTKKTTTKYNAMQHCLLFFFFFSLNGDKWQLKPTTLLLQNWEPSKKVYLTSMLATLSMQREWRKKKKRKPHLPCHIHTMPFFRKKPKCTYCRVRILNNASAPVHHPRCAIAISNICAHLKFNFSTLQNDATKVPK